MVISDWLNGTDASRHNRSMLHTSVFKQRQWDHADTAANTHTQAADTHIVHLYSEVVRIRKYKSHYRVVSYTDFCSSWYNCHSWLGIKDIYKKRLSSWLRTIYIYSLPILVSDFFFFFFFFSPSNAASRSTPVNSVDKQHFVVVVGSH